MRRKYDGDGVGLPDLAGNKGGGGDVVREGGLRVVICMVRIGFMVSVFVLVGDMAEARVVHWDIFCELCGE